MTKLCLVTLLVLFLPVAVTGMLVGGVSPLNATFADPPVVWSLININNHFKQTDKLAATRTLVRIISATVQVVQGEKMHYEFYLKGGPKDEICKYTVWYRMWLKTPDDLIGSDLTCQQQQITSSVDPPPSKTVSAHMTEGDVQNALGYLVDRINDQSNSLYRQVPDGGTVTKEVTPQGLMYHFSNLHMVQTTCSNHDGKSRGLVSLNQCPRSQDLPNLPSRSGDVFWNGTIKKGPRYSVTLKS